jgi:hypothetical protein
VVRVYRYLIEGDPRLVKGLLVRDVDPDVIESQIRRLDVELPGGYVGLRYGLSMVLDDPLLAETSFYGLLVNIKQGFMEGFTFFYDSSPSVSITDPAGNENHINWGRFNIGYGFDVKLSDLKFDVTPKLGVLNWDSRLSALTASGDWIPFDLKLDNAINVGVELGIELLIPLLSTRAWIGSDGAVGVFNQLTQSSVSSFRGGLDAYYTLGPIFTDGIREYGVALLGFMFFDWVTISNPSNSTVLVQTPDEDYDTNLEKLEYISTFMGVGISLTW